MHPSSTKANSRRRSIVITGASSGIGRATALRLAARGWRVFAAVRKSSDARSIEREACGPLEALFLDLCDRKSIETAASGVAQRLEGRGLDALFNNAGIGIIDPVEYLSPADLEKAFAVNVFGQVAMTQAFLPLLRKSKGRILNTGSVGDHLTPPFGAAVAAPKAALASISMALRLELRPQGIHVILIEPGSIHTPAVTKTLGGVDQRIAAFPPSGRLLYGRAMRTMARTFATKERAGSPPEAVAAVVERALLDHRPRTRYPAGKDSRKLIGLAKILPEKLLDLAILRAFGLSGAFDREVDRQDPDATDVARSPLDG